MFPTPSLFHVTLLIKPPGGTRPIDQSKKLLEIGRKKSKESPRRRMNVPGCLVFKPGKSNGVSDREDERIVCFTAWLSGCEAENTV